MRVGLNLLYLRPGIVGGTESYATGLIYELKRRLNGKKLWIFINEETKDARLFIDKNINIINCPVPAKMSFLRYFYEQFILPFQIKIIGLDLLHSLGYVQPFYVPCKSVVTIHDLNYMNIGEYMSPLRRNILKYFIAQSAKRSDHIITISNFSKSQIVRALNIPPRKITVTYNSIKKRPDLPLEFQAIAKIYGIRKPYLFALGSSSPHKNIEKLVEAFLILKRKGRVEGQLVISGHIPEMKNNIAPLVKKMRLENDIITTGYIPDSHLVVLYKNAEVFVFPSLYEGFGIPVLEAFYYGAPVACSNVSAIPEIAGDAAVYFNPKDVYDIANAIDLLLKDKNKRLELVSKGRARLNLFTWEKAADITLKVYHDVLNK
jgi:glycosyltransferase involved in cell wall biosynthesis